MSRLEELAKKFDASPAEVDDLWSIPDLVRWVGQQDCMFYDEGNQQIALDYVVEYVLGNQKHRHKDLIHAVFDPLIAPVAPSAVVVGKPMWDRDFLKEAYLRAFEIVSSDITPRDRTELFTALVNFVNQANLDPKQSPGVQEVIEA